MSAIACYKATAGPVVGNGRRTGPELADIIRRYGPAYRQDHRLRYEQHKALNAIEACRTAALGGHEESCPRCGYTRHAYNSCRNRHCPKCQRLTKAAWLEDRKAELLPVPYFHLVFSLPHELNPLALSNRKTVIDLLFRSASQTLLTFGRNELGGRLGFTMILHTWDQKLNVHFHLHCLIAGGALAGDDADSRRWVPTGPRFLFPVRALSKVFRGKFLAGLKRLHRKQVLTFDGQFPALLERVYRKPWNLYAKAPFGGADQTLEYLGRYTHRVAIGNHRILSIDDGTVRFTYRDRRHGDTTKVLSLEAPEFIRRFLLHVLPDRLVRIRHFGFLANRCKAWALAQCRRSLGLPVPQQTPPPRTVAEWMLVLANVDIHACPRCGHRPLLRVELPPNHPPWRPHGREPPRAGNRAIR